MTERLLRSPMLTSKLLTVGMHYIFCNTGGKPGGPYPLRKDIAIIHRCTTPLSNLLSHVSCGSTNSSDILSAYIMLPGQHVKVQYQLVCKR